MVKCPLKSAQKLNMSSHSGLEPNVECDTWHAVLRTMCVRRGCMSTRTKKAESFSLQLLQGFWSKLKKKNPENRWDVPDCYYDELQANRSHMATVPFVLGCCRASKPWRQTLSYFWRLEPGKIWWLKKVLYLQKKYHCQ